MSDKNSRSGGKYTGNHTTLIPTAAVICDIAHKCNHVTKITPGYIRAGLKALRGQRRLKMSPSENGTILLAVRDNTTVQEIRVFSNDVATTMSWIEANIPRRQNIVVTRADFQKDALL